MRLLFDQNISHRIIKLLPGDFEGSTSVKDLGLLNANDREIWEFAKIHEYVIVTQDSDFNDLNLIFGYPPKIIWLRTGNLRTEEIVKILNDYFKEISEFVEDNKFGCFEILKI